jgi:phenylacetate-CoA ligase
MTLRVEAAPGDTAAVEATLKDVTKVRGEVLAVAAGSLPNDGKVIEDLRKY